MLSWVTVAALGEADAAWLSTADALGAGLAAVDGLDVPPGVHAARSALEPARPVAYRNPRRFIGWSASLCIRRSSSPSCCSAFVMCPPPTAGRSGFWRGYDPSTKLASSCHRTITGSPGPTPGAPPAPAAF